VLNELVLEKFNLEKHWMLFILLVNDQDFYQGSDFGIPN